MLSIFPTCEKGDGVTLAREVINRGDYRDIPRDVGDY